MIKRKAVSVNTQQCEVHVDGEALGAVAAKLEAGYRDVILLTLYRAHGIPAAAPSVLTSQDARNLATALQSAARMADKGALWPQREFAVGCGDEAGGFQPVRIRYAAGTRDPIMRHVEALQRVDDSGCVHAANPGEIAQHMRVRLTHA